jgi:hypothetical protein
MNNLKNFDVKFYMVNGDQFNFKYTSTTLELLTSFIENGLNQNFLSDEEGKYFINTKNINGFEIEERVEVTA